MENVETNKAICFEKDRMWINGQSYHCSYTMTYLDDVRILACVLPTYIFENENNDERLAIENSLVVNNVGRFEFNPDLTAVYITKENPLYADFFKTSAQRLFEVCEKRSFDLRKNINIQKPTKQDVGFMEELVKLSEAIDFFKTTEKEIGAKITNNLILFPDYISIDGMDYAIKSFYVDELGSSTVFKITFHSLNIAKAVMEDISSCYSDSYVAGDTLYIIGGFPLFENLTKQFILLFEGSGKEKRNLKKLKRN